MLSKQTDVPPHYQRDPGRGISRFAHIDGCLVHFVRKIERDHQHLLKDHPAIEDPNQMAVPAGPDLSAGIFRWNRIVRLLHLDMTVTMDRTFGFLETGESA